MKRALFVLALLSLLTAAQLSAQTLRTIAEIREPAAADNDTSAIHGELIEVEGVVVTNPNDWYQAVQENVRYSFWIQQEGQNGPNSGLQIRLNDGTQAGGTGITGLRPGMKIRLVGTVDYFTGEIQIALSPDHEINVTGTNVPLAEKQVVEVSSLNNDAGVAQIETGTPWEGVYVKLENLNVISVNGAADRGNFTVADAEGNTIIIWDANKDMRASAAGFTKPAVGVTFSAISGVVYHRAFTWPGSYEIHPYSTSDFEIDTNTVPPAIGGIQRSPVCPKASEAVTVSAQVTHASGTAISRVQLRYAVGPTSNQYTTVEMTGSGDTYTGTIPAQAAATFVHYHLTAEDANGNTVSAPTSSNRLSSYSYTVNDGGCSIRDIQYAGHSFHPFGETERNYESGYRSHTVTDVKGIVTAAANPSNLNALYIQQRGVSAYAGVQITGQGIAGLNIGDSVSVTGTVRENFGQTLIEATQTNKLGEATPITPVRVAVSVFETDVIGATANRREEIEGMLVELRENTPLLVVQAKAEEQTFPDNINTNRVNDWRVGLERNNPTTGARIMTGGPSGARTSKAVGFINSPDWQANLTSGVDTFNIDESGRFCFEAIRGIVQYDWNLWRLAPRNNDDVMPDTTCPLGTSRKAPRIAADQIKLYPNPAGTWFAIETDRALSSVELLDLTGRVVLRSELSKGRISVADLNAGVYLVRITDEAGAVGIQRLIITQ